MKKKIQKINQLLIDHFGIPPKSKKLPDPLDTILEQFYRRILMIVILIKRIET
jgi:hypothetical protein